MKQLVIACVRVAFLSLLAVLPAKPAAAAYGRHYPPAKVLPTKTCPVVPRAGAARAARAATSPRQFQLLVAPPRLAWPEQRGADRQVVATTVLPQLITLRGMVVRPTGQPCAGASVYVAQTPRQLTVTDSQGAFTLSVVADTAVVLRVEYLGEGSSRVKVPLPTAAVLHIVLGQ